MSIPVLYPYLFFLLFVRFLAFISLAPLFSQRTFPVPAKIGLAGLLAFIMAPFSPAVDLPQNDLIFATLIVQEVLIGLLLGFAALVPLLAIGLVGQFMASAMGTSYATSVSPLFQETTPPIGQFYMQFALLLFLGIRADRVVILALKRLVETVPPGIFLSELVAGSGELMLGCVITITERMWTVSMQLALPVIGTVLLADLALVLVSRAMPRMNAFSQSLPLKVMIGLLTMLLGYPYFVPQIAREMDLVGRQMLSLFQ